ALFAVAMVVAAGAKTEESSAFYSATWAGLPAGEIRLTLRDDPAGYRNEIQIRTEGLAHLLTRFSASAVGEGRLAAPPLPTPYRYEAIFDLRKARDRHLSMRFAPRAAGLQATSLVFPIVIAERGPGDTSKKPPLPEQ